MPLFSAFLIGILIEARRFDEAIAAFDEAIEMDAHSPLAYFHGGCGYYGKGMLDEARAAFERSLALTDFAGWAEGMLGFVLADQGRPEDAARVLQTMIEKRSSHYVSAPCIAFLAWRLGQADQAFEYLDKGIDERDTLIALLDVYPFVDDLRREPRFQALLARLRFPPPSRPPLTGNIASSRTGNR